MAIAVHSTIHLLSGPPGTDGLSTIWTKFAYPATLRRCTVGHSAVGAGADVPEHHSNRLTFHCGRRIAQDAPADGATGLMPTRPQHHDDRLVSCRFINILQQALHLQRPDRQPGHYQVVRVP